MEKKCVANRLTEIFSVSKGPAQYMRDYSVYLSSLLSEIDYTVIEDIIRCFLEARKRSSTIYFVGNGGSAATASHFAQDLAEVGRKCKKQGFKSQSLTNDMSFITALANDYGYEDIFTGQMNDSFRDGDVLVAISASGNSPNVVKAVEYAKKKGGITIALVGFDGGKLSRLCDHVLHIITRPGEYGPVEDLHLVLDHMITSYFIMALAEGSSG